MVEDTPLDAEEQDAWNRGEWQPPDDYLLWLDSVDAKLSLPTPENTADPFAA